MEYYLYKFNYIRFWLQNFMSDKRFQSIKIYCIRINEDIRGEWNGNWVQGEKRTI